MIYSEFSFPNDMYIFWSLMIVTYPFITGLIAGAFIASALYHVFGRKELRPVNRFALIVSLSFMICATFPLLNHLGHPERALNIIITPNYRSAIAGFGFIYSFYFIVLALEVWFSYREDIINNYKHSHGWAKKIWKLLTFGVHKITPEEKVIDGKIIHALAVIGIPGACILHGYVGFLFGSLKSNPWWSTPLMPFVFLLSAIMSGLALLILLYQLLSWKGILEDSYECLRSLCVFLWFSMVGYIVAEGVELLFFFYESSDAWFVISTLLFTKLRITFFVLQLGIGLSVSFIILSAILVLKMKRRTFYFLSATASAFALFEVWMMRWNIVIGGQLFSKSYVGFREYLPHWFEKEGILAAIAITLLPLLILYLFSRVINLRPEAAEAE